MLIGHSGCAHLGYFPRNPRTVTIDGNTLPIREHDGHVAHRLIVDGMIAAPLGEVGKLAAAVATARRPTGAARALVSFVRTRTPIARPGSHAFPSRRYLTT